MTTTEQLVSGGAGGGTVGPDYGKMTADANASIDQSKAQTAAANASTDAINASTTATTAGINREADQRMADLQKAIAATAAANNLPPPATQTMASTGGSTAIGASPTPPNGALSSGGADDSQNPLQKWGQQLTQSIIGLIQHVSGRGARF